MDYLISSGGCPTVSGQIYDLICPGTQPVLSPEGIWVNKPLNTPEMLDEHYRLLNGDKMCYVEPEIREPRPLRPKPTPAPPKINIQGAPVDLISHYEKLVDRLEREIERLTAELERVRSE